MSALYICYQSICDPLTQTQVVAYLEGLAQAGYTIVLLTFEPRRLSSDECRNWNQRLAAKGIAWHWLRYHKWPTVPATAWDVFTGIVKGWRLSRTYKVRLLHARGHVPAVMGLVLKRMTGAKLLFDIRGFMAEEYVDAGVWTSGGRLFRLTKRVERLLVEAADAIVVLTQQARELLAQWYPEVASTPVTVIPCCVDFRNVAAPGPSLPLSPMKVAPTIIYTGKLGGWYLTEAMVDFVASIREQIPDLRWIVRTQSDTEPFRRLLEKRNLNGSVDIGFVPHENLPAELAKARVALSLIKPCLSKRASSPTKVGEYLAAGLPVISTAGIGDLDALLTDAKGDLGGPVGVVLPACNSEAYCKARYPLLQLLNDPGTASRCRAAAKHFELENIGWLRYRKVYEGLLPGIG